MLASGPDDFPNGPTYAAATAKFGRLATGLDPEKPALGETVGNLVVAYLKHIEPRRAANTLRGRRAHLRAFAALFGDRYAVSLKHADFAHFLTARTGGKRTAATRRGRLSANSVLTYHASLSACFKWACKPGVGMLRTNPLEGFELPLPTSRGREALVSDEQHLAALKTARREFRALLIALENTGARPGELCGATAADWDDSRGALVFYPDRTRGEGEFRHKTAGKDTTRTILFTGPALEMMRGLVRDRPAGPLFRAKHGGALGHKAVCKLFSGLRKRTGFPALTAYSYRHTFATRWLSSGRSVDLLAALLGNSPAVIRRHYSHLLADLDRLRGELEGFKQAQGTPANRPAELRVVG